MRSNDIEGAGTLIGEAERLRLLQSVEKWIVNRAAQYARKFPTVDAKDLAQEGRISAWNATERFEASRGVHFLSYCRKCIDRRMVRFASQTMNDVRVPAGKTFSSPITMLSLDAMAIRWDEEAGEIGEIFRSNEVSPYEQAERQSTVKRLIEKFARLSARERLVLQRRFWNEETLREIGSALGLTPERIRQIEARALQKLRQRTKIEETEEDR